MGIEWGTDSARAARSARRRQAGGCPFGPPCLGPLQVGTGVPASRSAFPGYVSVGRHDPTVDPPVFARRGPARSTVPLPSDRRRPVDADVERRRRRFVRRGRGVRMLKSTSGVFVAWPVSLRGCVGPSSAEKAGLLRSRKISKHLLKRIKNHSYASTDSHRRAHLSTIRRARFGRSESPLSKSLDRRAL